MQYLIFCLVFVACNKEDRINKDPIYIKMRGKWTEINSNDPTTYEFSESGKVSIWRPVEREIIFYPNTITNSKGHIYINGAKWDYFGFTDGKTKADCGFFINNNWDSICKDYGVKINNSTSTYEYVFYTKK